MVLSSGVLSRVSGKQLCVPAPNLRLPSSQGLGSGEGQCGAPSKEKFFDFEAQNGEFWCILGDLVYSSATDLHAKKLVLLFFENLQRFTFAICNIEQLSF